MGGMTLIIRNVYFISVDEGSQLVSCEEDE